jgi:hypothetical protein
MRPMDSDFGDRLAEVLSRWFMAEAPRHCLAKRPRQAVRRRARWWAIARKRAAGSLQSLRPTTDEASAVTVHGRDKTLPDKTTTARLLPGSESSSAWSLKALLDRL